MEEADEHGVNDNSFYGHVGLKPALPELAALSKDTVASVAES